MQKDTLAPPPPAPLASNTAQGEGRQASTSGAPSKNETGRHASPKTRRKPSISKVILGVVTDKGMRNCVSLATLKKAVTAMGYDMTWNAWRFKRVLKGLVDKGVLKQVTGKGALGSFRMGKKFASKFKLRDQRQRQSGQHRPGQRRPGKRRPLVGSRRGHKQLRKEVRRVAKCRRN
uniref:spermatid-specific linker histone H1-like protein n=1 Tax=Odobenus rosmarus divergens TaxID=9708 RepID=UPI00063CAD50|nr:PREDICTED: spermatid-specific linker histone H1-like protein [Odobenus rosmarus divergens]